MLKFHLVSKEGRKLKLEVLFEIGAMNCKKCQGKWVLFILKKNTITSMSEKKKSKVGLPITVLYFYK